MTVGSFAPVPCAIAGSQAGLGAPVDLVARPMQGEYPDDAGTKIQPRVARHAGPARFYCPGGDAHV